MALPQVVEIQVMETTEKRRVYEGTAADILAVLQSNAFAGQRLRLIVKPEKDLSENMPDPPVYGTG